MPFDPSTAVPVTAEEPESPAVSAPTSAPAAFDPATAKPDVGPVAQPSAQEEDAAFGTIRAATPSEKFGSLIDRYTGSLMKPALTMAPLHEEGVEPHWADVPLTIGGKLAEQAVTPVNLLTAGLGAVLAPLAKAGSVAAKTALRSISAGFGAQGLKDLAMKQLYEPGENASETAAPSERTHEPITPKDAISAFETLMNLGQIALGAHGAIHGVTGEAVAPAEARATPEAAQPAAAASVPAAEAVAPAPVESPAPVAQFDPKTAVPEATMSEAAKSAPREPSISGHPTTFDPATAKPEPAPQADEPMRNTYGIAARVSDIRAEEGHIEPVVQGEGISAQDSVTHGRELLTQGGDPIQALDDFSRTARISSDDIALVRAHGERLAQAANAAADRFGVESPEYDTAAKADSDWTAAIKPMQTEWHKIGQAQQGETEIDTGTFHGLRRGFKEIADRDFTPEEAGTAKEVAQKVTKAVTEAEDAKNKVFNAIKAEVPSAAPEGESPNINGYAHRLAKAFVASGITERGALIDAVHAELKKVVPDITRREAMDAISGYGEFSPLKNDPASVTLRDLKGQMQQLGKLEDMKDGNPPAKTGIERRTPSDTERDLIKKVNEAKKAGNFNVTDPASQLKTYLQTAETRLDNQIADLERQIRLEEPFEPTKKSGPTNAAIEAKQDRLDALKAERQNLRDRLQPKAEPGYQVPGSVADIWARAKSYLEQGETDFDDIRHKIAVDTGLPVQEVTEKLAAPKAAREITNEMYAKMAKRRDAVQNAKNWLKNQATPGWLRFIKMVPRVFFVDKIMGHGTVGMITHAGLNIFHPEAWKTYWPNFIKQFKLLGSAYHEQAMQDLVRDPNYTTARRAGLANSPNKAMDDYQGSWVGNALSRLGASGNRGFDALKTFRQARFNQIWEGLPTGMRTKDNAKMIADGINHATGVVRTPFREWSNWAFFAPKLEGSRWAWMVGDPAKAAKILGAWDKATPEERQFAIRQVKEKATIAGVYLSLLATNQGLLSAAGSSQKINVTDPRKSDFLAFKAGGHKFGIISPLLGVVRLLANLVHASIGEREGHEKQESRSEQIATLGGSYLRGKLSPFAGFAADMATQADFQGRPMPFSDDNVPAYLRKRGVDRYSYGEYAAKQFTPIPVSEAITEVWRDQGIGEADIGKWMTAILTGALAGATGARMSPDYPASSPQPTDSVHRRGGGARH